jgi:polar amino acid transport system substrate-binding protein
VTARSTGRLFGLRLCLLLLVCAAVGADETIVFNSSYSPPYSTPDGSGILDRIIFEVGRRIGRQTAVVQVPAERSLRDANSGFVDGDIARIRGIEEAYPNLVMVDVAIIEHRDFVAFAVEDIPFSGRWSDLDDFHVGYVRGWKIIENNLQSPASAVGVPSTDALFEMLGAGRIDVAVSARLDGLAVAAEKHLAEVRVLEPPFSSLRLYPYLHSSLGAVVPDFERALREMKRDGTFARIYREGMAAHVGDSHHREGVTDD